MPQLELTIADDPLNNRQAELSIRPASISADQMTTGNNMNGRGDGHQKVIAVLPPGGAAAKEPRYVNCVENKLGLPDFLKGRADVVVTADKEGADSGALHIVRVLWVAGHMYTTRLPCMTPS